MADWGSVSGAPVFIADKLAGVIRRYATYLNESGEQVSLKNQLQASYLKLLWESTEPNEAKFREVIEQYCPRAAFDYHQKKLSSLISKLDALNIQSHELLQKGTPEIVASFTQAQQLAKDAVKYDTALLAAICAKYEQNPGSGTADSEQPFEEVPVARADTAEFFMAAETQRDPSLSRKMVTYPSGKTLPKVIADTKYSLVCPPEFGLEGYNYADVTDALLGACADDRLVIDRLFGDFEADTSRDYDKDDRLLIARDVLEESDGRYYWPVRVKSGQSTEAIKKIAKELPQLRILKLSDELKLDQEEAKLFKALLAFIKD